MEGREGRSGRPREEDEELKVAAIKVREKEEKAANEAKGAFDRENRLKKQAQEQVRALKAANSGLAFADIAGLTPNGDDDMIQCQRLEIARLRQCAESHKVAAEAWDSIRSTKKTSKGKGRGRGSIQISDKFRPHAFEMAGTGASGQVIHDMMQSTLKHAFGEKGKKFWEEIPSVSHFQKLSQTQLPCFMEAYVAVIISAASKGLCISWDEGSVQKRHGGTINITGWGLSYTAEQASSEKPYTPPRPIGRQLSF